MTIGTIGTWRRVAGGAQAALFLGLPFASVRGESALRFDVPTATLHFFGARVATDELFVVLPATLLAVFGFLWVTATWGRVWCGWSCPQTVLGDLTRLVQRDQRARPRRWRRPAGFAIAALLAAACSAATLWYFVPPDAFLARLRAGTLGPALGWTWAILGLTLFLDLVFLRARFCATACPYAKLQGALFDRATLVVAYDRARDADCVDCDACVRACPTGIDIRDGLQMECIACAECVDACAPIMAKLKRAPKLVGYFWGEPGARRRILRPATVALGAATLFCLGATIAVAASRAPLDLVAAPAADFSPRVSAGGRSLNAFQVALENRGEAPLAVRLAVEGPGLDASVRPAEISLAPRERRSVRVVVEARGLPRGAHAEATLAAEARRPGAAALRAAQGITLFAPEAR